MRQEEREREEKVRVGIAKDKREREVFVQSLERAKIEETRQQKRRKKISYVNPGVESGEISQSLAASAGDKRREPEFAQRSVHVASERNAESEEVTRALSRIF